MTSHLSPESPERAAADSHDGGRVVFTGTPADLVAHGDSLTAQHLRAYVSRPENGRLTGA